MKGENKKMYVPQPLADAGVCEGGGGGGGGKNTSAVVYYLSLQATKRDFCLR